MRAGNPVLSNRILGQTRRLAPTTETMTIGGAINKSLLLIGVVFLVGMLSFELRNNILTFGGVIVGLILAFVIAFKPQRAPMLAPVYAVAQGLALGGISFAYAGAYTGIIFQAIILTIAVAACMLLIYRSGLIKPTRRFQIGITSAVGAVGVFYLVSIVGNLFGFSLMNQLPFGIQIGISVLIVGIAAFSLILDFDLIQKSAESGQPKFMEWYGAFALLVTLVWLYLEILRLLARLNSRR